MLLLLLLLLLILLIGKLLIGGLGVVSQCTVWPDALASAFCERSLVSFDDGLHALMNAPQGRPRAIEPAWLMTAYPRCVHVGRCEPASSGAEPAGDAETAAEAGACNATADLADFARTWVAPVRVGGALMQTPNAMDALGSRAMPRHPRTAWRVDEGVALCRGRYTPDSSTGALVGVARPQNKTMPQKFADLCMAILKHTRG